MRTRRASKSPPYGGSYSRSYANSRRDRRLTFDSDSGSPPWHRLWEKTWHHYCVTYAAVPKEKDRPRNVTFYVDGVAEDTWKATVNTSLGSPLYIGADVQGSKTLDGAVDEVYVYEDALDAWQVGVLYGIISPPPSAVPTALPTSVPTGLPTPLPSPVPTTGPTGLPTTVPTPGPSPQPTNVPTGMPTTARPTALPSIAPTVSPAPTSHWFPGSLIAYYDFADGTTHDIYQGWDGTPETMATTEGRDGGTAIALDHGAAVTLPPEATQDVLGDADRTVCMWARIDEWNGGCLFYYGGDGSQGTSSGGDGAGSDAVTGGAMSYSYSYSYVAANRRLGGSGGLGRARRNLQGSDIRDWSAIASSADGARLAATVSSGSIYTSADSGASWTEDATAGARSWVSIAMSADGQRRHAEGSIDPSYCDVYGSLWTSSDFGASWTEQAGLGSECWRGVAVSGDGATVAAVVDRGQHLGLDGLRLQLE